MKIDLLHITDDAENKIGMYASICYNSRNEREANIKRAAQVTEKGHLACLRFAHAVFHISGISRICSHQFVRSKHLDVLQRSQRYCSESDAQFVFPGTDLDTKISGLYQVAHRVYKELLAEGIKKEDARFVLPEGTQTEMVVVGNLQAWLDFIKLRADKHAQWEIRNVAKTINNELNKHCPNIFKWMA